MTLYSFIIVKLTGLFLSLSYVIFYLFFRPLGSSGDNVVVSVLVHHAQDTHRRLVSATVRLQQLVVLSADLLSHLSRCFHQLVLHHGWVLIVRLEVSLAVRRQAHQAGLLGLLPPRGAEVAQNVSALGLVPGLVTAGGATRLFQAAVSV